MSWLVSAYLCVGVLLTMKMWKDFEDYRARDWFGTFTSYLVILGVFFWPALLAMLAYHVVCNISSLDDGAEPESGDIK